MLALTFFRHFRSAHSTVALVLLAFAVFVTGFAIPDVAMADTVGPAYAGLGSTSTSVGTRTWYNPGNITADDGSAAVTAQLNAGNPISRYLRGSDFGFNVPVGSTITGIRVEIMRWGSAANYVRDYEVRLAKGSTIVGGNKASSSLWPTSRTPASYGGMSDLWGTTWTPAEINSGDFSVLLSAQRVAGSVTASVDYIAATVAYTPPATSYTLTYSAGTGGTISGTSPQTVTHGGSGTPVTAVPNAGYYFVGWSDLVLTATRTDTNVTANLSVNAIFAPLSYTLTYTAGPGGTISGTSPQSVAHGGSGTPVTAVPNTGYYFAGWSDLVLTATRTDTNVTANLSVNAIFAPLSYTLSYSAGPGGTISGTSPQTVTHGGSGTPVTAVPNTGYTFVQWSDGLTTATRTDTNVTANLSVNAIFAPLSYTLTYSAGTGGTISGTSPQTVTHGGSGTPVTAVPNTDYTFVQWSDGLTTATRTDTNVTANLSVNAIFAPYPLVYPFDGGQVVFTQVASSGGITVTRQAPRHPDPAGYKLLTSSCHEITVNHTFTGSATVSIEYQTTELAGAPEAGLRMFRWTGTSWQELPSTVDSANKIVSGTTAQFSDFAVAAPTATEPPPVVSTTASSTWSLIVLMLLGSALAFAVRVRQGDSRA